MKTLATLAFAVAASISFAAAGPTAKQATDITFKIIELEDVPKGDKSGISRAFLDCQYRLAASGGEDKTELAMMNELSDFMTSYDSNPSSKNLERMIKKIKIDKALRTCIKTDDDVILAYCESVAAGGNPSISDVRKAVKDRKTDIAKRSQLWSPACRKTCSKQTSGM